MLAVPLFQIMARTMFLLGFNFMQIKWHRFQIGNKYNMQ